MLPAMQGFFAGITRSHDLLLLGAAVALSLLGILTMGDFGDPEGFAARQTLWLVLALGAYVLVARQDLSFLSRTSVVITLYGLALAALVAVLFMPAIQGARSWFSIGPFALQPSEFAKLVLVVVLAKYFSRRHVEIANARHIIVSGAYVAVPMLLVLLQPDFGTAIIYGLLWLAVVLVSGIRKEHLALILALAALAGSALWFFGFEEYQRERIVTFLNPTADIRGAGYNAYQSMVAVGSGELFGKGVGYGTQSKLKFLPEYETDFIFAAYAEEWGFAGVLIALSLYALLLSRIVDVARRAGRNFDAFVALGVASLFLIHTAIHAGINLGVLPVTGTTIPFMSSGGSHLLASFIALGMVTSLRRHCRSAHKSALDRSVTLT